MAKSWPRACRTGRGFFAILPRMWDSKRARLSRVRRRRAVGSQRLDMESRTQTLHSIGDIETSIDITLNRSGDMFQGNKRFAPIWNGLGRVVPSTRNFVNVVSGSEFSDGGAAVENGRVLMKNKACHRSSTSAPGSPTGIISVKALVSRAAIKTRLFGTRLDVFPDESTRVPCKPTGRVTGAEAGTVCFTSTAVNRGRSRSS